VDPDHDGASLRLSLMIRYTCAAASTVPVIPKTTESAKSVEGSAAQPSSEHPNIEADYLQLELDESAAALMSEQQIVELLDAVASLALSQTRFHVSGLHLYNSKPSSEISFLRRVDRNPDAPLRHVHHSRGHHG
jgi:hypothetical protein